MKNAPNCLDEGKKKLAEGDLPSAVLYFEAAAQQNPQNAEAWRLLGTSQVSGSNFAESTFTRALDPPYRAQSYLFSKSTPQSPRLEKRMPYRAHTLKIARLEERTSERFHT